ncbi:ABC transporter permease subunit [Caproiciproducens sp. MSJ-32]|uniref:ABC transporter permease subunit n=1 Tax=Caproiciproducens sp. MSJ-32 TaxID=2841527 RepID=UPI001C112296|nr:ABC transporter permease subunit [Caproiciproducens sp. MSJ-32]MBU5456080.1 ABC transporter permease [Caproiciproducens sp. MSJ-32]
MLFSLIKNEFIKIFKRGKTWIVFALFLIFIALTIYGNWKGEQNMKEINSPEYQLQMAEDQLAYYKEELKNAEASGDEAWIESIKSSIEYYEKSIELNKKILKEGISEDTWKTELDMSIDNIKNTIKEYEKNGTKERYKNDYISLQEELEILEYLKANSIVPLKGWEYQEYNFLESLSTLLGIGLLVAGIAVFMSDILSGEATPPTLKFLLVQPVSRAKILLSKYIVSVITVLTLIIIPEILGMTFVNLTSNINVGNYPVRVGQQYEKVFNPEYGEMVLEKIPETSEMITNFDLAVRTIGYQAIFIITCCSVIFMFSTLFKSSMISMAVSVILTIFLSIGTQVIGTLRIYSHLLFTTYADSYNLISSKLPLMYNNEKLTITNGIICLILTIIISYLISHINFKNKDILI